VLDAAGFSAAHTTVTQYSATQAYETEQILASDSSGVHVLDTVASQHPVSQPPTSYLTGVKLAGDTLSWNRGDTPESAQLQ